MSQGIAPEIWTQQGFDFTIAQVEAHDGGGYGVPQEMVPAIAAAVLDTLASLDIDPQDVYLSGHDGLAEDPDAEKVGGRAEFIEEILEYDEYLHSGETDDSIHDPDRDYAEDTDAEDYMHRQTRDEIVLGNLEPDGPEKPVYFMSHALTLHDTKNDRTNPIHYAGITTTSTVVVYDRTLIDRWDADMSGEATIPGPSIVATEAELAVTVLARLRLRYRIEDEPDLSPPPIPNN